MESVKAVPPNACSFNQVTSRINNSRPLFKGDDPYLMGSVEGSLNSVGRFLSEREPSMS